MSGDQNDDDKRNCRDTKNRRDMKALIATIGTYAEMFSKNGWWIGLAIVAVLSIFLAVNHALVGYRLYEITNEGDVALGVTYYLAIAAAAITLTRLSEFSLEGFGLKASAQQPVVNTVNADTATLEKLVRRVAQIEQGIKAIKAFDLPDEKNLPRPPLIPIQIHNDQQKNRFGREARSHGYELSADFPGDKNAPFVNARLMVRPIDGQELVDPVQFFLHETFKPEDEVVVTPEDNIATLNRLVRGGFTVGAWIPSKQVMLELDLSKIPGAPRVVREL